LPLLASSDLVQANSALIAAPDRSFSSIATFANVRSNGP